MALGVGAAFVGGVGAGVARADESATESSVGVSDTATGAQESAASGAGSGTEASTETADDDSQGGVSAPESSSDREDVDDSDIELVEDLDDEPAAADGEAEIDFGAQNDEVAVDTDGGVGEVVADEDIELVAEDSAGSAGEGVAGGGYVSAVREPGPVEVEDVASEQEHSAAPVLADESFLVVTDEALTEVGSSVGLFTDEVDMSGAEVLEPAEADPGVGAVVDAVVEVASSVLSPWDVSGTDGVPSSPVLAALLAWGRREGQRTLTSSGQEEFQVAAMAAAAVVNTAPTAVNDSLFTVVKNGSITFTYAMLLGNDVDPDTASGDVLSVNSVYAAKGMVVHDAASKTVTYTPVAGYTGPASFIYRVKDATGAVSANTATVNITVSEPREVTAIGTVTLPGSDDWSEISSDGTRIVMTTKSGDYAAGYTTHIAVINTATLTTIGDAISITGEVDSVRLFKDDTRAVITVVGEDSEGADQTQVVLVDVTSGTQIGSTLIISGRPESDAEDDDFWSGVYVAPDNSRVVIVATDWSTDEVTRVLVADADTGAEITELVNVDQVRFTEDGTRMLVAATLLGSDGSPTTHMAVLATSSGLQIGSGVSVSGFLGDLQVSTNQTRAIITALSEPEWTDLDFSTDVSTVVVVDLTTGDQLGSSIAQMGYSVATLNTDGSRAIITTASGGSASGLTTTVLMIDTATGAQVGNPLILNGFAAAPALFVPDGSRALVALYSLDDPESWGPDATNVAVVDAVTGAQLGSTLTVQGQPYVDGDIESYTPVHLNNDGSRAVISTVTVDELGDEVARFAILNTSTGVQVGSTLLLAGHPESWSNGFEPYFSADGERAYVASVSGSYDTGFNSHFAVLDTASGAQLGSTLSLNGHAYGWEEFSLDDSRGFVIADRIDDTTGRQVAEVAIVNTLTGAQVGSTHTFSVDGSVWGHYIDDGARVLIMAVEGYGESESTTATLLDASTGTQVGTPLVINGDVNWTFELNFLRLTALAASSGGPGAPDTTRLMVLNNDTGAQTGSPITLSGKLGQLDFSDDASHGFISAVTGDQESGYATQVTILSIGESDTTPVNTAPVAVNDGPFTVVSGGSITLTYGQLLGNDIDPDTASGDVLSVNSVYASNGSVVNNAAVRTVTYTPVAGYSGPASFIYRVRDASGAVSANTATVALSVVAPNTAPVAVNDGPFTVVSGGSLTLTYGQLLGNDIDPDTASGDVLSVNSVYASNGSVVNNAAARTVTYTPVAGYTGPASFIYRVRDASGAVSATTATVSVTVADGSPTYTITSINPVTGAVEGKVDGIAQGVETSYQVATPVDNRFGNVIINPATGAWTYTPSTAALLEAWGTTHDDFATFVLTADVDGVAASIVVEVPSEVSEASLFAILERLGSQPSGVAVGASGDMYVINSGSNTLSLVDRLSGAMSTVPVGRIPSDVAVGGDNRIWVTNTADGTVSVFAADGTQVATISVGLAPSAIAVDDDNGWVYVTNFGDNSVSVIDPSDNRIAHTLSDVGLNPIDIGVGPQGKLYLTNFNGASITVVDPAAGYSIRTIALGASNPHGIVAVNDGTVYVTHPLDDVVSILTPDVGGGYSQAAVTVLGSPTGISYGAGGIYVTTSSGVKALQLQGQHSAVFGEFDEVNANSVFADDSGGVYFTSANDDVLTVADTINGTVERYDVGVISQHVTEINGNLVFTSTYDGATVPMAITQPDVRPEDVEFSSLNADLDPYHPYASVVVSRDGHTTYVAGNTGIAVINNITNTRVALVPILPSGLFGSAVNDLALSADGSRLYALTTLRSAPEPAYYPDWTTTIAVINTGTNQVESYLPLTPGLGFYGVPMAAYGVSMALSPDSSRIYVSGLRSSGGLGGPHVNLIDGEAIIWVLDTESGETISSRSLTNESSAVEAAWAMEASPDGLDVYFLYSADTDSDGFLESLLGVVDTTTNAFRSSLTTGEYDWTDSSDYATDLAISSDGTRIYLSNGRIVDTTWSQLTLLEQRVGGTGHFVLLNKSEDRVYFTSRQGNVTIVDTAANEVVGSVALGSGIVEAAISPVSGKLYFASPVAPSETAPAFVEELWADVSRFATGNDDTDGIFIKTVRDDTGTHRMIVYLGGTTAEADGNQGWLENIQSELGVVKADQRQAIQDVLNQCASTACGTIDEILIVGYSQGGIDAQNLANVGESRLSPLDLFPTWDGFTVNGNPVPISTIVTFGSPIVANPHVTALHIQDDWDEVVNFEALARYATWLTPLPPSVKASLVASRLIALAEDKVFRGDSPTSINIFNPFQVHGDYETYRWLSAKFDSETDNEFDMQRENLARFLGGTFIDAGNLTQL